ncbi:M14 family zinc carboxypeptidase [Micromonospora siamensis]|uniref:Zinc carboxypeptidase n=1 Tax=Micromonospora siamensis TaxID=299152 RepID=A0A1C5IR73_9ACTN|nr:Proprotein convertase P-domain-containing protein [Micromonospora siamensis]
MPRRIPTLCAALLGGAALLASATAAAGAPVDPGPRAAATADPDAAAPYRVTHLKSQADVDAVARTGAAIDHVEHGELTVSATPAEVRAITRLGLRTVALSTAPEVGTMAFPAADAAYHDHAETIAAVDAIVAAHPTIASKQVIGTSYEGRDIVALKISDNVGADEPEPEVLFTANQHAREHLTVEQALYLADQLTGRYGADARVTRLVDSREFWIIPMVNPDGVEYDIATGTYRSWRKNRQPNSGSTAVGTDLNRNWGYKWGCCGGSSKYPSSDTYRGPSAFSAPETKAVRDFVLGRRIGGVQQIKAAIDFHSYSELVLWPFGYTSAGVVTGMTADQNLMFKTIGQQLAATNGYTAEQASALYVTDGSIDDWLWGDQGIVNFTFELYPTDPTVGFYPPASVIPTETARNREAVLLLSEYADCPYRAIGKAATYCPSPDDFTMAASPSTGTVAAGASVTTTVTTTVSAGSAQQLTLSASGLPAGASAIFFPPTITAGQSATMTVTTAPGTTPASYAVTVTGTGSVVTRSTTYGLDVDGRPGCTASNDTDLTIPELASAASPVTIGGCAGNATATSSVEVHIVHPYIGDLVVSLIAPDGTEYVLHDRAGGGADNIDRTFPVDLSSEVANGTWNLRVSDESFGDSGYLDRWSLSL